VTLDGLASTDNDSIASYQWSQTLGTGVSLSDPSLPNPTFTAPLYSLLTGETLQFALTVTDVDGLEGTTLVNVTVLPVSPQDVFAVEEPVIPFQFGVDVDGAIGYRFDTDFTGVATSEYGSFAFTWSEIPGTLTIDFTTSGGLIISEYSYSQDVDADMVVEDILVVEKILAAQYVVQVNGPSKDVINATSVVEYSEFNVTDGIDHVAPSTTNNISVQNFYDSTLSIPFVIADGEIRALPTNISATIPTLRFAPAPEIDSLLFNINGTGFAAEKNAAFNWSVQADGHLRVDFTPSGIAETADYYHTATRDSGDQVVTRYTYADTSVRVTASLSFTDDPAVVWDPDPALLAGIYVSAESETLDNGSVIPTESYYRINPDGTGVLESPVYDLATGLVTDWFASGFGICASIDGNGDMVWKRTRSLDQLFSGSRIPSPSHCATLATLNDEVSFQRDHQLYDVGPAGELRMVVRNSINNCGFFPNQFPAPVGCDSTILDTDSYFAP
jgi:hypothetical protein